MILTVKHTTIYKYSEYPARSVQMIRLSPQNNSHQTVVSWSVKTPISAFTTFDWFGNKSLCLAFDKSNIRHRAIEIVAKGEVITNSLSSNNEIGSLPLDYYLNSTELTDYSSAMEMIANDFKHLQSLSDESSLLDGFTHLSSRILTDVPYTTGVTNAVTSAATALDMAAGVCQDHSHIMLSIARKLGFPARYVSGYIYSTDTSHVASHAWLEIWFVNAWHSFDVSNQCQAGEAHIILAYGLDYVDASPIRGSRIGGGDEEMETYTIVQVNP